MKALGNVKTQKIMPKLGYLALTTSIYLRLNAFVNKNNVLCAKTRVFRAKNAFFAHYRFYRNESTGKRANALQFCKIRPSRR